MGSGTNLHARVSDYFQPWYYTYRNNLPIVRAIKKYGLDKFHLIILDFVEDKDILESEQFWLNKIQPEYNILTEAGNSQGYKHRPENIEKIRNSSLGRKHSTEVRKAMSENRKGLNNNFFGKYHTQNVKDQLRNIALNRSKQPRPGFEVEIKDIETNTIVVYSSIREAARNIGTTISVLHRRDKLGIVKPFRNRYYINIKRN